MLIRPARSINGTITLPGDKSISHRAAMIAAMAEGETRIDNFASGADCSSTLDCLRALGVDIRRDGNVVFVTGVGKMGFLKPHKVMDCSNSGTTMRLLAGILAGQGFESNVDGDISLRKRPMARVIEPLAQMGAVIESNDGLAPLTIRGAKLQSIEYELPVASAQIKSCILLAGLNADGKTTVTEREKTRDHTERMLDWFGGPATIKEGGAGSSISVSGDATLRARDCVVPGDLSAAAFFIAAAACLPDSEIVLPNVATNPTRSGFLEILRNLGLGVQYDEPRDQCNEPVATLRITGPLKFDIASPTILNGKIIANIIDEIPILAVLGTQLETGIEIRDAGELRLKETDRIAAIVENLRGMRAEVTEFPDGFKVGRSDLKGARVDSFGDHRIAMAFAVAGLLAEGNTEIEGSECVAASYPAFFETLAAVVR